MNKITKLLIAITLCLAPQYSVYAADFRLQEQALVDIANAMAEKHNLPSRVGLATDPRDLGQMADQILTRNGFECNVIHDKDVKAFLVANSLDLEAAWEEQFPQDQPDGIMQSIASILGFGSSERNQGIDPVKTALLESNFNDELRACLAGRLTTIRELVQTALQNPAPLENNPLSVLFTQGDQDLQDELTAALLEYFKLENILVRAAKGDGYIVDLPSTPLMVIAGNVHRVVSFARLKQEVLDYKSTEKKINRFRNELFNNHRFDDSDPYWSDEATEQRKKLYSKIILGSMALCWCSGACAYKWHLDMVKAQKKCISQEQAAGQGDATTQENPHGHALPQKKQNKANAQASYFEYLCQQAENDSVCPTKLELHDDTCPRELEFELLDFDNLELIYSETGGMNGGGLYEDNKGTKYYLKKLSTDAATSEYVGSKVLRLLLGENTIAKIRLIKDRPELIASVELPGFFDMYISPVADGDMAGKRAMIAAMEFIGLYDRHSANMGTVTIGGVPHASRVDYDMSFSEMYAPRMCPYKPCEAFVDPVRETIMVPQSYLEETVNDALNTMACNDPNLDVGTVYTNIMDRLNINKSILCSGLKLHEILRHGRALSDC